MNEGKANLVGRRSHVSFVNDDTFLDLLLFKNRDESARTQKSKQKYSTSVEILATHADLYPSAKG